jgi:hypothetical protein
VAVTRNKISMGALSIRYPLYFEQIALMTVLFSKDVWVVLLVVPSVYFSIPYLKL